MNINKRPRLKVAEFIEAVLVYINASHPSSTGTTNRLNVRNRPHYQATEIALYLFYF